MSEGPENLETYIVLLRGINVGGRNPLPMKALKSSLEAGGFSNVRTYIQSGNIVLQSKTDPTHKVASLIQSDFGLSPEILVLSEAGFGASVARNPFPDLEGKTVHFFYCKEPPTADLSKAAALAAESERYELIGDVFYLHAPDGIGRSKLAARVEACLGVAASGRNLNTVNKLREMLL